MATVNYTTTGSSSLGGTAGGAGLVQKAYDPVQEFALRSEPLIRSVADKRPARQAIPGSTVVLQRYVDLAPTTSTLTSANVRKAVAKLRAGKSIARKGSMYWAGIHPEVSHDLRAETGAGGWRLPHEYNSNENIWAGEIGSYEGAYFVESPRLYNALDGAGTTAARVYRTILCGQQALAEAVAEEPHVVIGPVVDRLMRHRPMGWYGVLGFKRYREEALYRIESGSSIAS
jgi:N4-gp56 family major capsid protein